MRRLTWLVMFFFWVSCSLRAQQPVAAQRVLEDAKAQAVQQHKVIFFVFSASWCGPCHKLDAFLNAPETRGIVEKYFVVAKVNILENAGKHPELQSPGGDELAEKLGGNGQAMTAGVPVIVFLNAAGEPIINSMRPIKGSDRRANIGYPDTPEEIDWFGVMLKKAVPQMSPEELRTMDEWLRKASAEKK
jgi:thiol-disulfide isomerase/thioredoxin